MIKLFKRKKVQSKRLIIRPLLATDYEVWKDAYINSEPAKSKWDSGPIPLSKCTKRWFNKIKKRHEVLAKNDDCYWYGVFEKKSGALVGHIDFDIFVRSTHQFANYGYSIYNRHWGKGYGQEAAVVGLQIGFKQLGLHRLEATINLDNKKSIRLCKAIGMHKEGIKKKYWFENGEWTDHIIYVANPEDFKF